MNFWDEDRCAHNELPGCCASCSTTSFVKPFVRTFSRGDTFTFPVYVTQLPPGALPGQQPFTQDITGWNFWCTGKYNLSDPDMSAVFQLTTTPANGIVIVPPSSQGLVLVTVPPIVTTSFADSDIKIYYDVQGKDTLGNIFTVERGKMIVTPDVTRAIA